MRCFFLKAAFFFSLSFLNCGNTFAQIIDYNREIPYKKVFVATDNFSTSYLDTLARAFSKAKTKPVKYAILNDLAYYWHTRNLVKAMEFTQTGLQLTSAKQDSLWNGRFQITQGAILLRMEQLDQAEQVLESARCKVLETDMPLLNTQLGYVYERRGELGKAADFAMETLHLGKKLNDKWAIAMAYSDLSNLFWKQSKFETALAYGVKSLAIFEQRGINDLDYDFTLFVVGNNYLALKEYDKALNYIRHSIAIGERYGFYNNLSDAYMLMVDLYLALNEFEKAEEAGVNALKYAELLSNNFMVMRSWLCIGKVQNLSGDHEAAIASLTKCIEVATEDFGDNFQLSRAYEALGNAYAKNQNFEDAYTAFQKYEALKDLVFTAEADQRISELRTEFDVAQKESTILLQYSQIAKQRTSKNLFFIIAVLLLILLVLAIKAVQNKFKINTLLQQQNTEKEFLLKEIHHRVKNNLEIVSSLLSLQSAKISDVGILDAMRESQHRVQSMGMIHQKLYVGENLASVEMKGYFMNLGDYIIDAFGLDAQVDVNIAMEELELDVDMAIPIGLIVNELLTNALKYAFPDGRKGVIKIRLKKEDDILRLDVTDNGVGKISGSNPQGTGFGTQLIELLTKQLDGKMVLNTNRGTSVSIQFQLPKAA